MKLSGNTILITGGTSGIGLGLAERLHDAGNRVVVAGRRVELLDRITATHRGIEAVELDISDRESIERAHELVNVRYPELNVLINNAGIMHQEDLLEPTNLALAESHIETNLLGTIRMTYQFLPLLVGKSNATLINVTSALAFAPWPATPTYSATKAALHSFTESLRVQVAGADAGVQVMELVPPNVRTTLLGQQNDQRAMPLEEFVAEIMELLRTNPDAEELVVQRARFFRAAGANRSYR